MIDDIRRIAADARSRIETATTLDELAEHERSVLGKGGDLGAVKRQMGSLDHDRRREVGTALNEARRDLESAAAERRGVLEAEAARVRAEAERLHLTEVRADRD